MKTKDIILYGIIFVLLVLFLWQWSAKGALIKQMNELSRLYPQMQALSGIGHLRSTHQHADVKVYVNGKAVDFSQPKYQLRNTFIHFEEGIGDVVHVHATGLTMGHLLKSLGVEFSSNCIVLDSQSLCNDGNKRLRFYANGKASNEFDNHVIDDLDKILVSYGSESEAQLQQQLNSVTDMARKYSKK